MVTKKETLTRLYSALNNDVQGRAHVDSEGMALAVTIRVDVVGLDVMTFARNMDTVIVELQRLRALMVKDNK